MKRLVRAVPLVLLVLVLANAQPSAPPEANLAIFVQLSDTTVTMLPRLMRSIWHPRNLYVIHFDKKIPQWKATHAHAALFKSAPDYKSNVHILPSEVVTYRGISMVLNLLNAIQFALDKSDWHFFLNLSGSDYPLLSPLSIRQLLASADFLAQNRSFLSFSDPKWWLESKGFRYSRLYTDTSLSLNHSSSQVIDSYTDNPLASIANFTFTAAEAWMILHRDYCKFLLTAPLSRRLLLAFAYSLEPEEHYFSTLVYNSRFNSSTIPHALRFVAWVHNGKHSGQHPYYIDTKQNSTYPFLSRIFASGCIFARKIRLQDSPFLDLLDSNFNGLAPHPNSTAVTLYRNQVTSTLNCITKLRVGNDPTPCVSPS